MKFIKNLKLNNFEGWTNGNIEFKNGFNIIMGDSDSGKSSIFRAIESIFTGKCLPENINKNAKNLKIILTTSDNDILIREYGKNLNKISFNDKKFERIGREVPSEYFDFLGKSFIYLNDKNKIDLCLYSQFDPHFFINFSDYDKSKLIGSVCGIGSIDKIVDLINKDIRENNSKIKVFEEQIKEKKPKIEKLNEEYNIEKKNLEFYKDNLDKINNDFSLLKFYYDSFNELNEIDKKIDDINQKINKNKIIINSFDIKELNNFKVFYEEYTNYLKINNNLNLVLKNIENNKKIVNYKLENIEYFYNIFIIEKQLFENNEIINKINFNLLKNKKIIDINIPKNEELKTLFFIYKQIKQLKEKNDYLNLSIEQNNNKLNSLLNVKKSLLKDIKICPLCGGNLHE